MRIAITARSVRSGVHAKSGWRQDRQWAASLRCGMDHLSGRRTFDIDFLPSLADRASLVLWNPALKLNW